MAWLYQRPMSTLATDLLTIREAAERLAVTPRTLKYYEERGLVCPSRSEGRYRLYSPQDLERFARVLRLRSLGFSLQAITEMLKRPVEALADGRKVHSQAALVEIHDALTRQVEALDARIDAVSRELHEARRLRAELGDDLAYLERRIAGEAVDTVLPQRLAARQRRPAQS